MSTYYKLYVLPKLNSQYNSILIEIPKRYFVGLYHLICKFIKNKEEEQRHFSQRRTKRENLPTKE